MKRSMTRHPSRHLKLAHPGVHGLRAADDRPLTEPRPEDRGDDPAEHEAEQQDEPHAEPHVADVEGDRRERPAPEDERAVRHDERAPDLDEALYERLAELADPPVLLADAVEEVHLRVDADAARDGERRRRVRV